MRFVFAGLLGAVLGFGLGVGGVLLWLGLVAAYCLLHDLCTAKRRREFNSRLADLR